LRYLTFFGINIGYSSPADYALAGARRGVRSR
jgi:hypothetical protein